MDNPKMMQFSLMDERSEESVLDLLNEMLGFSVESMDFEIPNSLGFAQVMLRDDGYRHSFTILWPSNIHQKSSSEEVAKKIAIVLNVCVLLELPSKEASDNDIWLLINPDGRIRKTPIKYLEDGVVPFAADGT